MINFIILGGGWRSEFYLRIAKALPREFCVKGVYIRNSEKGRLISEKYNVGVFNSLDEILKEDFDFIVNCVKYADVAKTSIELADRGYFVLCETPALIEPSGNHRYDKIQIAEQYHQKGTYQAIKKIIDMNLLGDIGYINLSLGHDYHAMSMLRFFFSDYEKPKKLFTENFTDALCVTTGRGGLKFNESPSNTTEQLIVFDFNGKCGIYDYNSEQYFSPIRRDRLVIRGTKGEIENNRIRYFDENNALVEGEITLKVSGLLEGFYNDKILLNGTVLYDFPYKEARLSEEECAIAMCLSGMKKYIDTGEEFYSYKKAYEDYSFFKD